HQKHVLVDFGLQLELELCSRKAAPRALGHVDEVTHAFDELAETIEVGLLRKRRSKDLDLDGAVGGIADANGFPPAAIGGKHAEEGLDRGHALQTIKLFEAALHPAGHEYAVPHGAYWSPPLPRRGTNPRAPSSRASVADPDRSHRS